MSEKCQGRSKCERRNRKILQTLHEHRESVAMQKGKMPFHF